MLGLSWLGSRRFWSKVVLCSILHNNIFHELVWTLRSWGAFRSLKSATDALVAISDRWGAIYFFLDARELFRDFHEVRDHWFRSHVESSSLSTILLLGVLWDQTLIECVQLSISRTFNAFIAHVGIDLISLLKHVRIWRGLKVAALTILKNGIVHETTSFVLLRALNLDML